MFACHSLESELVSRVMEPGTVIEDEGVTHKALVGGGKDYSQLYLMS